MANQMFSVLEIHQSNQLHGGVTVGEGGVEDLVVRARTLPGKTGRSGISVRERDHKNQDMFRTLLSWG